MRSFASMAGQGVMGQVPPSQTPLYTGICSYMYLT